VAFSALALGALVVAAYFLKQRPRPYEVSALFLWPEAASKAKTSWRWYRAPLGLLLLQLLALLLLVGALARPVAPLQAREAGRIALVVDTSASMQTVSKGSTRLERALQAAKALVSQHKNAEFTVVEARVGGGVVLALSRDWRRALSALSAFKVRNAGDAPLEAVAQWVQSQAAWETFSQVVWFGDRVPPGAGQDVPLDVELFQGGQNDLAISAFYLRQQPDPALGYEGFVRVENFSNAPLSTTLSVEAPSGTVAAAVLDVAAQGSTLYTFGLPRLPSSRLSARLDTPDSFNADNARYFAFQPQSAPRVLWLGEPDRFFLGALYALGVPEVVPWTAGTKLAPRDLLVVNGTTLPGSVKGNVLLLDADWEGVVTTRFVYGVERVRATDLAHPVLRGVSPEDIVVANSRLADLPPGFVPLLNADSQEPQGSHPALGVYEAPGVRLAWIGFSLRESNLRLTVDFPILVANLVRWLVPSSPEAALLETGMPLYVGSPGGTITLPSTKEEVVEGDTFLDTDAPGFYALNDTQRVWAANVPPAESTPPAEVEPPSAPVRAAASAAGPGALQPLWLWWGWLGFAVLGLEWFGYERGWL